MKAKVLDKRNSSVELMRIMLMMFLIIHHFIVSMPSAADSPYLMSLDVLCHSAAGTFILISGFYGIHFRIAKLLDLLLYVVFYSLLMCLFARYYLGTASWKDIFKCFLPITNGYYWFVAAYLKLFIFSPFVNIILEKIKGKQYVLFMLALLFLIYYIGMIRSSILSFDGLHIQNFILLYCLGNGLKRLTAIIESHKTLIRCCVISFVFVVIAIVYFSCTMNYLDHWLLSLFYHYHSPGLIFLSICIFLFFITFEYKSRAVNYICMSSLAIYLFHEHPFVQNFLYKNFFSSLKASVSEVLIYFIIGSISLMIFAIFIDQFRLFIRRIMKPLAVMVDTRIYKLYSKCSL